MWRIYVVVVVLQLCQVIPSFSSNSNNDIAFVDVKRIVLTSSEGKDDEGQTIRRYTGSLIRLSTALDRCHSGFLHKVEEERNLFDGEEFNITHSRKCEVPKNIRLECPDLNITSESKELLVEPPEDVPGRMFALLFRNEFNDMNLDPKKTFSVLLIRDELKWGELDEKGRWRSRCTIRVNDTIVSVEPILHAPTKMPSPKKSKQIGTQLHTIGKILPYQMKSAQAMRRDGDDDDDDYEDYEDEVPRQRQQELFPATKIEIEKAKETVQNTTRVFLPDTDFARLMNRYVGTFASGIVEVASARTSKHHPIHSDTNNTNKQNHKLHNIIKDAVHQTIRTSSTLYPNISTSEEHDTNEAEKRAVHHRRVTAANARKVLLGLIETHAQVENALLQGVRSKEVFGMIIDTIMNMMPEIIVQIIIAVLAPLLGQLIGMILSCILPPLLVPSEGEVPCVVADKKGKKMKVANEPFTKPCRCDKGNGKFFFLELDEYNALNRVDAMACTCSNEEDGEDAPGFLETQDPPDNMQNEGAAAADDPITVAKKSIAYLVSDMLNAQAYPAIEAAISNALIGRLRDELGPSIQRGVTRELTRSLVVSLSTDITRELLGVLTHTLTVKSTKELTKSLIPSLVMSLSPSLTRTLTHDPKTDMYCFYCKENKVYCKECESAQKTEEWNDYYTHYYASYYAKYNAEEYGRDKGIADAISSRQLMKQRGMQQTTRGGHDRWWLGQDG